MYLMISKEYFCHVHAALAHTLLLLFYIFFCFFFSPSFHAHARRS